MNAKEKEVLSDMARDMDYNVERVRSFIAKKGGLTIDGFIYRVEVQAKEITQLVGYRKR